MRLAPCRGLLQQVAVARGVAGVAGLQIAVGGVDVGVGGGRGAGVDDFQLVAASLAQFGSLYEGVFGREGYPVDAGKHGARAVGLDGDAPAAVVQRGDEFGCDEKGGFASGEYDPRGGMAGDGFHDAPGGHHGRALVRRVAEGAAQVAAGKAHKDAWAAGVVAFALQGVEYFVDGVFFHNASRSKPGFTYRATFPSDSWKETL